MSVLFSFIRWNWCALLTHQKISTWCSCIFFRWNSVAVCAIFLMISLSFYYTAIMQNDFERSQYNYLLMCCPFAWRVRAQKPKPCTHMNFCFLITLIDCITSHNFGESIWDTAPHHLVTIAYITLSLWHLDSVQYIDENVYSTAIDIFSSNNKITEKKTNTKYGNL